MSQKADIFSNLGIATGVTYETIISTLSQHGEYNAAPMAIRSEDGTSIVLRPYKTARTYYNLITTRNAVANFTDDPFLFFVTAFKEEGFNDPEMLTKVEEVHVPRLTKADSFLELQVMKVEETAERAVVTCSPIHGEIINLPTKPYCRGKFAAIEAVIHATRVKVFLADGRMREAESLVRMIHAYRDLVYRVAPSSSYSIVVGKVVDLVEKWGMEDFRE